MPLFASPRKRKQSPSRLPSAAAYPNALEESTPLRSRQRGAPVLPITTSDIASPAAVKKSPRGASNNFLLGGMYVPGKDNKRIRRKHQHRKRRFRSSGMCSGSSSTMCGGVSVLVVLIYWFFIMRRRQLPLDALFHNSILEDLPPIQHEQRTIEKLFIERARIRETNKSKRMDALERFIPEWFHRNTLQKKKVNPMPPTLVDLGKDSSATKRPLHESPQKTSATMEAIDNEHHNTLKSDTITVPNPIPLDQQEKTQKQRHEGEVLITNPAPQLHPTTTVQVPAVSPTETMGKERHALRTLQTTDTNYTSQCSSAANTGDISVTLVIQSTWDRVWVVAETCERWKADPIVLVVAVRPDDEMQQGWTEKCPQLRVIVHTLSEEETVHYPVNYLRNVALDAVQTSHVLVVDVDFVPSVGLNEKIREELSSGEPKRALVVPAFDRVLHPPCASDEDCRTYLQQDSTFLPRTFAELETCYDQKDCIVFQSDTNWEGHSSTRSKDWLQRKWYDDTASSNEHPKPRSIQCFDSLRYEPYVVIQWCPNSGTAKRPLAPYYDERFKGYGKNKIQYIFHLRMMAYKFSVLPEGFIVHNPHVESAVKRTWNNVKESSLHSDMDNLYQLFLKELVKKYYDTYGRDMIDQCERK